MSIAYYHRVHRNDVITHLFYFPSICVLVVAGFQIPFRITGGSCSFISLLGLKSVMYHGHVCIGCKL